MNIGDTVKTSTTGSRNVGEIVDAVGCNHWLVAFQNGITTTVPEDGLILVKGKGINKK